MEKLNLISEARVQALDLIERLDQDIFLYHDRYHTEQVAHVAEQLCQDEGLKDEAIANLSIAAWFHDTGYTDLEQHEQQSSENAKTFLHTVNCDVRSIDCITKLIMATKISHQPQTKDEEIIRDADLHYLGLDNYSERANLLRREWEISLQRKLTDREWYQENIKFFESHNFYTKSAQARFDRTKAKNFDKIMNLLAST